MYHFIVRKRFNVLPQGSYSRAFCQIWWKNANTRSIGSINTPSTILWANSRTPKLKDTCSDCRCSSMEPRMCIFCSPNPKISTSRRILLMKLVKRGLLMRMIQSYNPNCFSVIGGWGNTRHVIKKTTDDDVFEKLQLPELLTEEKQTKVVVQMTQGLFLVETTQMVFSIDIFRYCRWKGWSVRWRLAI